MIAGCSCKGLSRNRIDNLPNKGFNHKESGLFTEIPRILSLLKRLAKPAGMEIHHIVENVKMESKEHDEICSVLNGIPIMIQASRICASSRPRLFWCSFEVTPLEGETFEKNVKTNVLHMNTCFDFGCFLGSQVGSAQGFPTSFSMYSELEAKAAVPETRDNSWIQ